MELGKPLTLDDRAEMNRTLREWRGEKVDDKPDAQDYAMAQIVMAWGGTAKQEKQAMLDEVTRIPALYIASFVLVVIAIALTACGLAICRALIL